VIKLVAFDWNGTLVADTQTVVDCTNVQLKVFENKKINIKIYREYFEIPVNKFFENIGIDPKVVEKSYRKSGDIFHFEYEKRVNKCRTRRGAKTLLAWLSGQSIKSVVFSNHATQRINEQTGRLKLTKYLDAILANETIHDAYTIKGKEKRLLEYIERNKIKSSEVLVVGDTTEEITIAKDMNTQVVAISNGHSTTARLREAKPNYLINNLGQITSIIDKINH